jgi:hypothetical protein
VHQSQKCWVMKEADVAQAMLSAILLLLHKYRDVDMYTRTASW